eukprot:GEMP01082772.1.p1 GENE.GEMP01082772.1~~GEMP01082772.1.p1  ORF type:complete len:265 (+),score=52.08 GEMP01082772.1:232-1026(+)
MLIEANTCGETITINVGPGKQHIRWLGLAVALRYQKEFFPHAFRIPQRILNSEGTLIRPRAIICEELKDGEVVTVELRNGANVSEDLYDEDANWLEDAYGAASNLRDCKFYWKVSQGQYDVSIPAKVRGDYFVSPKWAAIYPQKEYGGRFEIPVEPVELRDGVVDWVATRKCPPGTCNYKFIMEDGTEMVLRAEVVVLPYLGRDLAIVLTVHVQRERTLRLKAHLGVDTFIKRHDPILPQLIRLKITTRDKTLKKKKKRVLIIL